LTINISPNSGRKLTIMGAVSSKRNILHYSVTYKTTEANVLSFWETVSQRFRLDEVVIVMDNHRAHSKKVCERLEELGAIILKLPVSSSTLNPIELVWGVVKQKWRIVLCK
jgi:transposase